VSEPRLAEVPEWAAAGPLAGLYADIRSVLGLPMVNLVYRHLATRPGLLERCWTALRPNLASSAAAAAATELGALAALGGPQVSLVAGLPEETVRLARATAGAYGRGNALNVLAMFALLDGCCGGAGGEEVPPPAPAPILPMASLDELAPPVAELLDEISLRVVGGEEPRLVPSLFRHFAGDERLLAASWAVLEPGLDEALERAGRVAGRARTLAADLPHPVPKLQDERARDVARRFSKATSRMLVCGELLGAALGEAA